MRRAYRKDWLRRYAAIARAARCGAAVNRAVAQARQWAARERRAGRQTLGQAALETLFEWESQRQAVAAWAAAHRVRHVVLADYSKTIHASWRAARLAGMDIRAVADNAAAFAGKAYRGAPILPDAQALAAGVDGVILTTVNPAQVDDRMESLRRSFHGPILRLWHPRFMHQHEESLAEAG
jgi:hypothetical protein